MLRSRHSDKWGGSPAVHVNGPALAHTNPVAGGGIGPERVGMAWFWLVMGLGICALIVTGVMHGALERSWSEVLRALIFPNTDSDLRYVIWQLRLPKVVAALVVGAALALSGVILQNVLANPLASSFTLGLSQGSAFGASFAMILLASAGAFGGISFVAMGAFLGAFTVALCILGFSMVPGMTPQGLILAGVALSSFFGAATMSLQYFAADSQVAATVFWTFGDLGKGSWREALLVGLVFCAALLFALRYSLDYDALRWGDVQAAALGVSVRKIRMLSLLLASLLTAFATAFYGVIGFVGLVAPHMIKLLFPHARHGTLVGAASLFGAFFLLAADLLAQTLLYPVLLPIGIVCAFTGVPMFMYLLLRRTRSNAHY